MASERQVSVGGVLIGGGAPVAVQTMTKTETANLAATMDQIHTVAEAGADIVRVAVPRKQDVEALRTIVARSPIPVIADIHFNHTLALEAIEAGAHCVRLNPGNIGGPEKVGEVVELARRRKTPLRVGVNSGSLPKHLRQLEFDDPVQALVSAAVETVELMERLDFFDFKLSMKSTSVPNTIASNRLLSQRIPYPLHLGVTEAGTKWSGSLKSAVGLGTLLADGIGDTIRISLSTFHAEEEVKVAWEILKALKLRERGPVLIACPTCGRLQFDMDTVVAEIERRLEAYEDPIEVSVLGCAVNGIGEARHADFGITGAKDMGMIYSKGEPLKKVPTEQLVDELFKEIDRYYAAGRRVQRDETAAAEAREWLAANEDSTQMTPERMAALEAQAAEQDIAAGALLDSMLHAPPLAAAPAANGAPAGNGAADGSGAAGGSGRTGGDDAPGDERAGSGSNAGKAPLDESVSPVAGRRFKRG
ncbi:MAG: flavodoxin-dependent (E)-4-hydroxy-3-methylbut-2-enyl-diphosphate synthase [Solirubrobacterales bacterium]|nr:flavodoxin-dependent (E)-4-hydroxy-3-methylbut-2-enyl-diphosphate synthase [Solirubrobacterales bacterium]